MSGLIKTAWRVVPEPVKLVLRGKTNSARQNLIDGPREWIALKLHQAMGGSYLDWYARRLDGFTGRTGSELSRSRYLMDTGVPDLEACKALGLREEHKLYEFGTGQGRTSQHFIRYLQKGHFSGNDSSPGRVDEMRELLKFLDLEAKEPNIYINKTNDFSWLPAGYKCDFFWCETVLCHMPDEDAEEIIANLKKIMTGSSIVLLCETHQAGSNDIIRPSVKDWLRPVSWYIAVAEKHGLKGEDVSSFLDYSKRGSYACNLARVATESVTTHLVKLTLR